MSQFIENLQYKIKHSSSSLLLKFFLAFIGVILGLTFALVGQQMIGYGTFAFFLVIVSSLFAFFRVSRSWSWSQATIFTFVCILLAMLLNMYIQLAPGA